LAAYVVGSIVNGESVEVASLDAENLAARGGDGANDSVFWQIDRSDWMESEAAVELPRVEAYQPKGGIEAPPWLKLPTERNLGR
jgi:hypothetical protein